MWQRPALTEWTYLDHFTCPRCGAERDMVRFRTSAGRLVGTWCFGCRDKVKVIAGEVASDAAATGGR